MPSGETTDVCVRSLAAMMHKASTFMIRDAMTSSLTEDKRRFLVAWGRLISASAEWMFVQIHAGVLAPADIVAVAELHIDAARTYLATRCKPEPVG